MVVTLDCVLETGVPLFLSHIQVGGFYALVELGCHKMVLGKKKLKTGISKFGLATTSIPTEVPKVHSEGIVEEESSIFLL